MDWLKQLVIVCLLSLSLVGCGGGNTSSTTPINLTVTQVTSNSASISWTPALDNSGYYSVYKIYRNGIQVGSISGATVFTDTNLQPAISYTYSVVGTSSTGVDTASSETATTTTLSLNLLFNKWDVIALIDYTGHETDLNLSPKISLISRYIDPSTLQYLTGNEPVSFCVIKMSDGSVLRHVTTTAKYIFSYINDGEGAYLSGEIL